MKDFLDLGNLYDQIKSIIASKTYIEMELPYAFKSQLPVIGDRNIVYHKYTAIAYKSNADSIIIPNYWFYLAIDILPFNIELHRYYDQVVNMGLFSLERLSELKTNNLSVAEKEKIESSFESKLDAERICKFLTDYRWWHGGKELGRGQKDYYVSAVLSLSGLVNDSSTFLSAICEVVREKPLLSKLLTDFYNEAKTNDSTILQQIFYGAPGTGKSHKIKDNVNVKEAEQKNLVFRTTFHPDSDYATFVGAYKPTMRAVADKYKAVAGKDEEITYSFVPQAFLQAYIAAWNYKEEQVYLIIEEINRGNCAQVFGDLFQLLDRDCDGFSEYPIMADSDLAKYLNGKDENGKDVLTNKDGIKDGKLRLPKNLYIWATMNTSDQSLFPIDSAFKRRWEWKYLPINNHEDKNYKIEIGSIKYDWWGFLSKINQVIGDTTSSEDKKLGYFFAKANDSGIVTAEQFVGKVLFYLWNDVFKNYGFDNQIFDKGDKKKFDFSEFFKQNGSPDTEMVNKFLGKLDETIDKENTFVEKTKDENGQGEQTDTL